NADQASNHELWEVTRGIRREVSHQRGPTRGPGKESEATSPHHLPCCSLSASSNGWSRLIVDFGAIQRYGCSLCWARRGRPGSGRVLGNFRPPTARPKWPHKLTKAAGPLAPAAPNCSASRWPHIAPSESPVSRGGHRAALRQAWVGGFCSLE